MTSTMPCWYIFFKCNTEIKEYHLHDIVFRRIVKFQNRIYSASGFLDMKQYVSGSLARFARSHLFSVARGGNEHTMTFRNTNSKLLLWKRQVLFQTLKIYIILSQDYVFLFKIMHYFHFCFVFLRHDGITSHERLLASVARVKS